MPSLAKILAKQLGGQKLIGFGSLSLVVIAQGERDPDNLSAGRPVTETIYPCKGRLGTKSSTVVQGNTLARVGRQVISILGGSLPTDIAPKVGHKIIRNGITYVITADGVANEDGIGAIYDCSVLVLGG